MSSRVVVITGCSRGGIGFELARAFHAKGCKVFATARKVDKMSGLDAAVQLVALDVTKRESISAAIKHIIKQAGRIDVLVNNAGQGLVAPIIEANLDQVRGAFETNVFGVMAVTQEVAPHMISAGRGLIVNIGSMVAYQATPWGGVYCATKAALHSLSDALALELKNFGINVMVVAPGAIKSLIGAANLDRLEPASEFSHYASVQDRILARASTSQQGSTPTDVLAREIAEKALSTQPPRYLTTGATTWKFLLMYYLPTWLSDRWAARLYGSDLVVAPKKVLQAKL